MSGAHAIIASIDGDPARVSACRLESETSHSSSAYGRAGWIFSCPGDQRDSRDPRRAASSRSVTAIDRAACCEVLPDPGDSLRQWTAN